MPTTGTCGHPLPEGWLDREAHSIIRKAQSRDGSPALSYETVCLPCRARIERDGELFETSAAADHWLDTIGSAHCDECSGWPLQSRVVDGAIWCAAHPDAGPLSR